MENNQNQSSSTPPAPSPQAKLEEVLNKAHAKPSWKTLKELVVEAKKAALYDYKNRISTLIDSDIEDLEDTK